VTMSYHISYDSRHSGVCDAKRARTSLLNLTLKTQSMHPDSNLDSCLNVIRGEWHVRPAEVKQEADGLKSLKPVEKGVWYSKDVQQILKRRLNKGSRNLKNTMRNPATRTPSICRSQT